MAQVQYFGTGRRKQSVARVRLVPGDGKVIINGRDADSYFPREYLKVHAQEPLEAAGAASRFESSWMLAAEEQQARQVPSEWHCQGPAAIR